MFLKWNSHFWPGQLSKKGESQIKTHKRADNLASPLAKKQEEAIGLFSAVHITGAIVLSQIPTQVKGMALR
jgi:hypothetical protein